MTTQKQSYLEKLELKRSAMLAAGLISCRWLPGWSRSARNRSRERSFVTEKARPSASAMPASTTKSVFSTTSRASRNISNEFIVERNLIRAVLFVQAVRNQFQFTCEAVVH